MAPLTNSAARQSHPQDPACCCPACLGLECLERPRFFPGQLLSDAELNSELDYLRAKNRLHNRYLFGWGVVCGLQVVYNDCAGWVTVKSGYALDPCGNDVIVCNDQDFNVLQAITNCCTPRAPRSDCDPYQFAPSANCQDAVQRWCLTIAYEEKEARPITPLRSSKPKRCGCCNGSGSGCGCSCHKTTAANSNGCSPASKSNGSAATMTACEPTRILEGYRLGVVPAPQPTDTTTPPNTFLGNFQSCFLKVQALILRAPNVEGMKNPQQAYQACCQYRQAVQSLLEQLSTTKCQPGLPPCPPPGQTDSYQNEINALKLRLVEESIDCLCLSLLPACPASPCDDRLILACITVQNGKIIEICNFDGRRQLLTFPALEYWLGSVPFVNDILKGIRQICCGEFERIGARLLADSGTSLPPTQATAEAVAPDDERFASTGIGNPGGIYQAVSSTVLQALGASVMQAVSPETVVSLLDTRPLIGQDTDLVLRQLEGRKIPVTLVSADLWTQEAVDSSPNYAPTAHPTADPLLVYTQGSQVVGFETANETQRLRLELNDLKGRLSKLEASMGSPSQATTG